MSTSAESCDVKKTKSHFLRNIIKKNILVLGNAIFIVKLYEQSYT